MAALTAALIAATVVAAGGAVAQGVQANQARQDAKGAANKQENDAAVTALYAKDASQKANDLSTSNALRDAAKARQQQIIGSNMGRGSTILTGGLGSSSTPPSAQRTLLGQ